MDEKFLRVPRWALRFLWFNSTTILGRENADVPARLHSYEGKPSIEKATAALRGEGVLWLPAKVAEAKPEQMQFSQKPKWK